MIGSALLLLKSSFVLSLHLSGAFASFPKPLTKEEEQEYLARYAEGDLEARNLLIERNLRLVAHIMKKYYTTAADQDDLISIGTIGLIKAISSYQPDKGVKLATYAARCIENAIPTQECFVLGIPTPRKLLTAQLLYQQYGRYEDITTVQDRLRWCRHHMGMEPNSLREWESEQTRISKKCWAKYFKGVITL